MYLNEKKCYCNTSFLLNSRYIKILFLYFKNSKRYIVYFYIGYLRNINGNFNYYIIEILYNIF